MHAKSTKDHSARDGELTSIQNTPQNLWSESVDRFMCKSNNVLLPKAMSKLQANLTLALAAHPGHHSPTPVSVGRIGQSVTDDSAQLMENVFAASEERIRRTSYRLVSMGG